MEMFEPLKAVGPEMTLSPLTDTFGPTPDREGTRRPSALSGWRT